MKERLIEAVLAEPSAVLVSATEDYIYIRCREHIAHQIARAARVQILQLPDRLSRRRSMWFVNLNWEYDGEGEVIPM